MEQSWICRLIVLEGKEPWAKVTSADLAEVLYAVRFTHVASDGTIRGELFTRVEYLSFTNGGDPSP